jgi:casein kinase 1
MVNMGEEDDQIYDWNLLNDGRGWDTQGVRFKQRIFSLITGSLYRILNLKPGGGSINQPNRREQDRAQRRIEDEQRRRSQQPSAQVPPPSPAVVRHGSKRRSPNALLAVGSGTGSATTPQSGAAHVNIPAPGMGMSTNPNVARRLSQQQGHPYANVSNGGSGIGGGIGDDAYGAYPRASPMAPSAAPPALSSIRAIGGEAGIASRDGYDQQMLDRDPPKPPLLMRILTCRC